MATKKKAEPIWMPHPAHLIVSHDCRFHLATYVDGYIVSTVGDYFPPGATKPETIGVDRLYETMVFEAKPHDEGCCPFRQASGTELDMAGYNDPGLARAGHMAMLAKWSDPKLREASR